MFDFELIELLNKYFNSEDDFSRNKIKSSISNLISQNKEKYNNFIETHSLDLDLKSKTLLEECLNQKLNVDEEKKTDSKPLTDMDFIKESFFNWNKEYELNNFKVNTNCELIIDNIINKFALSNLEVILKVLTINDNSNFEAFKQNLKNRLRLFFVKKVKDLRESNAFKNLGFFQRFKLKRRIFKLYKSLGNYNFNKNEIEEVLNFEK